MAAKKFYIGERYNPQTGTYYIPYGQLLQKEARAKENTIYGSLFCIGYSTKEEYEAHLDYLRESGARVH